MKNSDVLPRYKIDIILAVGATLADFLGRQWTRLDENNTTDIVMNSCFSAAQT